jgi:nicotinamide-nucleotide amidase
VVVVMADAPTHAAAVALLDLCKAKKLMVATAESCTGGLVAGALTDIAGSSAVVERGFVTYTNEAKQQMLGVPRDVLCQHGAVSRETAEAMAQGALRHSPADLAVSITGIAGPGGGTAAKPVGLVHFAAAARGAPLIHRERRFGDIGRAEVRRLSVLEALSMLAELAAKA